VIHHVFVCVNVLTNTRNARSSPYDCRQKISIINEVTRTVLIRQIEVRFADTRSVLDTVPRSLALSFVAIPLLVIFTR
jgi:hypothetical protein